jgi:DivIVA domain-containing protein
MDLTPLDIRNQEFRTKTFGGLDRDEVQAFFDSSGSRI